MDKQEIFDTVVNALRKQGSKSSDNNLRCLYRGPDNKKCAIGHLIIDEEYNQDMEDRSITHDIFINFRSRIGYEYNRFLVSLQNIHDDFEVETWETGWKFIAKEHNLIYTPPFHSDRECNVS